ncbi:bcl-2 homologous antagonist/killer isoform X2 [Lissotriton helveticus]
MDGRNNQPPDRPHHPRRETNEQRRRTSTTLNTEQVAQQTADVFRSYAFYRYQHEQEQAEYVANVPVDPEMVELPAAQSITIDVGRQLAVIGDDINTRYEGHFQDMILDLKPDMDNAYEYFTKIASSLFEDGINWGRVIALLGFGYRMALYVFHQHGIRGFLSRIAQFVATFVLRNRIAQWIAEQGGWTAALDLDNVYFKYVVAALALVLVGQFVLRRFFCP